MSHQVNGPDASIAKREPSEGISQTQLLWREFSRRRLPMFAALVIAVIFTVCTFAPFLAQGKPIWYQGVNRFEYKEAFSTVRAMMASGRDATFRPENVLGIERHLISISGMLIGQDRDDFRAASNQIHEALEKKSYDDLKKLRTDLQKRFGPNVVDLPIRRYWPVIEGLSAIEVGTMLVAVLLWTFALWIRWIPRKRRGSIAWSIVLGVPLLAGLTWFWCVPYRLDRTPYRQGALVGSEAETNAPVLYEQVVWPIIPFGLAEQNLSSTYLPPFWRKPDVRKASSDTPDSETKSEPATKNVTKSAPAGAWGIHVLGTDAQGRDTLCRLIWGGRVSLTVGILSVAIYTTIGIIVGAIAGYFRGVVDLLISRLIEIVICFPAFFLILTVVAFVGPNLINIMVIIGLTGWTGIARLVRAEFIRLSDQEFILAGKALGYSPARLIFRHVLPNAMAPVLVSATFGIAGAILTESGLSFLGLGIQVPTPSWGAMLADGRTAMSTQPALIQFPGLAIFVTMLCYNLVGEALRDAADPRLRGSRA